MLCFHGILLTFGVETKIIICKIVFFLSGERARFLVLNIRAQSRPQSPRFSWSARNTVVIYNACAYRHAIRSFDFKVAASNFSPDHTFNFRSPNLSI